MNDNTNAVKNPVTYRMTIDYTFDAENFAERTKEFIAQHGRPAGPDGADVDDVALNGKLAAALELVHAVSGDTIKVRSGRTLTCPLLGDGVFTTVQPDWHSRITIQVEKL